MTLVGEVVTIVMYGILSGLAFLLLPRILLCLCGFACGGVRKRSPASQWHSSIGDVEEGSCFACFQSNGAGGTPCGIKAGLFLFGCFLTVVLILVRDLGAEMKHAAELSNSTTPTNFTGFGFGLETTSSGFGLLNMTRAV